MKSEDAAEPIAPTVTLFAAADVAEILRERGWLDQPSGASESTALGVWLNRAAQLLGPHALDRETLARLLALVFAYDAPAMLREPVSHAALARAGAREVIRALANQVLEGGEIDSARFKQIIDSLKAALPYRGPSIFFPIRLSLAGQVGDGALDRVILLLDSAANLPFRAPVKSARQRILEFCAALD